MAQGIVWFVVRAESSEEAVTVTIRQKAGAMSLQDIFGGAHESSYGELLDGLTGEHRRFFDYLLNLTVQAKVQTVVALRLRNCSAYLSWCCHNRHHPFSAEPEIP